MADQDDISPRSDRIVAKTGVAIAWAMAAALAVAGAVIGANGCKVADGEARGVLERQGFADVDFGGASWLSCDPGEASREFTAMNVKGLRVSGVVCCGLIGKACTVRW